MSFNEKAYKFSIRDDTSFTVSSGEGEGETSETAGVMEVTVETIDPDTDKAVYSSVNYERLKNAFDNGVPSALCVKTQAKEPASGWNYRCYSIEGYDEDDPSALLYTHVLDKLLVHPDGSVVINDSLVVDDGPGVGGVS